MFCSEVSIDPSVHVFMPVKNSPYVISSLLSTLNILGMSAITILDSSDSPISIVPGFSDVLKVFAKERINIEYSYAPDSTLSQARHAMILDMAKSPCSHVMFMDSDIVIKNFEGHTYSTNFSRAPSFHAPYVVSTGNVAYESDPTKKPIQEAITLTITRPWLAQFSPDLASYFKSRHRSVPMAGLFALCIKTELIKGWDKAVGNYKEFLDNMEYLCPHEDMAFTRALAIVKDKPGSIYARDVVYHMGATRDRKWQNAKADSIEHMFIASDSMQALVRTQNTILKKDKPTYRNELILRYGLAKAKDSFPCEEAPDCSKPLE